VFGTYSFRILAGHRLSGLRFCVVFLSPSRKMPGKCLDCTRITFFQSLSSSSFICHPTIRRYDVVQLLPTFNKKLAFVILMRWMVSFDPRLMYMPEKRVPGIHATCGSVGHGTGLDSVVERKICSYAWNQTTILLLSSPRSLHWHCCANWNLNINWRVLSSGM
jgi:hypothetical protein